MQLAEQVNGLTGPGMKPWHLAATYQIFDDAGNPKDKGTFDMWWAAPDKYKVALASPGFTQTEYRTATGTYFVGAQEWAPYPYSAVQRELINPIPNVRDLRTARFDKSDSRLGDLQLQCLRRIPPQGSPLRLMVPSYCVSNDIPALRVKSSFRGTATFNDIVVLDGHYLARKIHVARNKIPVVHIEVTAVEQVLSALDEELTPPSIAVQAPAARADEPDSVIAGSQISGDSPQYPRDAGEPKMVGLVELAANISKEGRVTDLEVVKGPEQFQQAALDAVRTWRFHPSLLNGEPVEIHTTVLVLFRPR
jgi:TonB family protein